MYKLGIPISVIVFVLFVSAVLGAQSPTVVTQYTAGTFTSASDPTFCPCFLGMTFTTPSGGPWNNITFNLYSTPAVGNTPASNPTAVGTAFLLTQPYFGTPTNLSSSIPGYVASTATIAGGAYVFSPSIVISPNTQYWVYGNSAFASVTGVDHGLGASFPNVFISQSAASNFFEGEGIANFTVGGIPAPSGTCTYQTINPNGQALGGLTFFSAGGSVTINVSAPSGCPWTATSAANWITINGASNGSGNGTVTLQIAADTGLARSGAVNIGSNTGNLSFLIMQGAASVTGYTNGGAMAQLAQAGGWTTTFTFVNTGTSAAQMRLNFFNGSGNNLSLPLYFPQSPNAAGAIVGPTIDETIAPGAELVIQTTGRAEVATRTGWAQLLTNGSITGFATYSEVVGDGVQDALVPLQSGNVTGYIVPFDNTNGVSTGIALANTTNQAINVNVTTIIGGAVGSTIDGLNDGTTNIPLPPRSQMAFFASDLLTDTTQVRGTLKFSTGSPGQISVLALRFNPTGAFSTIPAIPTN